MNLVTKVAKMFSDIFGLLWKMAQVLCRTTVDTFWETLENNVYNIWSHCSQQMSLAELISYTWLINVLILSFSHCPESERFVKERERGKQTIYSETACLLGQTFNTLFNPPISDAFVSTELLLLHCTNDSTLTIACFIMINITFLSLQWNVS